MNSVRAAFYSATLDKHFHFLQTSEKYQQSAKQNKMLKVQVWQCAEQLCHPRFFFRCCIFANSLPLMNSTSFNVVSVWRKYILCTMKWMILCNILTDHHKFFCCLPTSEQNLGSLLAMWGGVVVEQCGFHEPSLTTEREISD